MLLKRIALCDAIRLLADGADLEKCPKFHDSITVAQEKRDALPPWLKLKCNFAQLKLWMAELSTIDSDAEAEKISPLVQTMIQAVFPAHTNIISDAWGVNNLSNDCVLSETILQMDVIYEKVEAGVEDTDLQALEDELHALDMVLKD